MSSLRVTKPIERTFLPTQKKHQIGVGGGESLIICITKTLEHL